MLRKSYKLFGSTAEFFIDADTISEPLMDEAYALALKLQKIFNIYDEISEISMLNKYRHITASPALIEVLNIALKLCEASNGEYDISLGKQFLLRKKGQELKKLECSYKDISVNGNNIRLLHDDVWIDLGSIAKGYIAEQISTFFIDQGIETGYIDARGDIRVFGDERTIGVQHPRDDGLISSIILKNKGVATSGDYRQYDKDYSKSHIINQKDIISATVVSDDLTIADGYASILMVCNKDVRENMINESGYPAMTIDKDLNVKYYNGFEKMITNEA